MSSEKIPKLDYVVAQPIAVERYKKNFFETKDSMSPTGHSLRAKVRMTFAGLKTKNRAVYLPDEHYRSAISFLKPYPKPIQLHHNDMTDPIGRVIDVRYVDTTREAATLDSRVAETMAIFKDSVKLKDKVAFKKAKLETVGTFLDLSKESNYKGVGHILGLWDVTDPDAIKKLLDGRYLTVSTGMAPKSAYCNVCAVEGELTDWAHEFCDHDRGRTYDGIECVAVPMDYEWEEVSPVNHPAAPLSQVIEVGQNLAFSDATASIDCHESKQAVFMDMYMIKENEDRAIRIRDGLEMKLPTLDEVSDSNLFPQDVSKEKDPAKTSDQKDPEVKAILSLEKKVEALSEDYDSFKTQILVDNRELLSENTLCDKKDAVIEGKSILTQEGTKTVAINLTDLTKDTESNYAAIAEHLEEGAPRLTGDLLGDLDDSVFIGPNRTFPVRDEAHLHAIRKLLEDVEDSEAKETLLKFLDEKEEELATDTNTESNTDENDNTENTTVESSETPENTEVVNVTTIDARELEELKALGDRVKGIELDRDLWRGKAEMLQKDNRRLESSHESLLSEQKQLFAKMLLDAQTSRGFKIEDPVASLARFKDRSIQSLKDSLDDLEGRALEGLAREPDGKEAPDPRITDENSSDEPQILDTNSSIDEYAGIVERYWNIYYGPGGENSAKNFLDSCKGRGIVPNTLQP